MLSSSRAMARIEKCPDELLLLVCTSFCVHCVHLDHFDVATPYDDEAGRWALLSLCRTSRRLRSIAQPVLHHRCYTLQQSFPDALLILRTLVDRPDLASQVRCADICITRYAPPDASTAKLPVPVQAALDHLGLAVPPLHGGAVNLHTGLGLSRTAAQLIAVLVRARVEVLRLHVRARNTEGGEPLWVLEQLFAAEMKMKRGSGREADGISASLAALMRFWNEAAHLRQLHTDHLDGSRRPDSAGMRLSCGRLGRTTDEMHALLAPCRTPLTAFVYEPDGILVQNITREWWPREAINELLQPLLPGCHADALKLLQLNFVNPAAASNGGAHMPSLRAFSRLRWLKTTADAIGLTMATTISAGEGHSGRLVQQLPASLETLALTAVTRDAAYHILSLASLQQPRTGSSPPLPHLRLVILSPCADGLGADLETALAEAFEPAGIVLALGGARWAETVWTYDSTVAPWTSSHSDAAKQSRERQDVGDLEF